MSNDKTKLLFDAIREGDLNLVKELVVFQGTGANSSMEYPDSPLVKTTKSALVQAVEYGRLEIVKFLVEVQARVNWMDNRYGTPCSIAKQLGFQEIADYLEPLTDPFLQDIAEGKIDLDALKQENDSIANSIMELFDAIENGNIQKVQELIESGIDVNVRFEDDITPLISAARNNNLSIVELLVKAGADVNALDADFESALLASKINQFREIEEFLEPLTSAEIREIVEQQMSEDE